MYHFVSAYWFKMLWRGPSRCPIGGVEGLYVRGHRCLAFTCIYCILHLMYINNPYWRMLLYMKGNRVLPICTSTDRKVTVIQLAYPPRSYFQVSIHLIPLPCPPSAPINPVPLDHTCPVWQGSRRLYFEPVLKSCPDLSFRSN